MELEVEPTFRLGRVEGILNRCYLCSPVPAGFVSVKVALEQRILPTSRLLFFPTKNILKWKTRSDVGVNKLYWIDGTGSLSDGMGLPCISKLYLLRMGRGGGVGLLTKRMEGL